MPFFPSLTLIGTVHRERRGGDRLRSLLRELQPDVITLEMSEAALAFRLGEALKQAERLEQLLDRVAAETSRDREELERHPAVVDIRLLLDLPFEYRHASRYAEEAGIPLHLVDRSDIAAAKLKLIESELISLQNLKTLVTLPAGTERSPAETKETARRLLRHGADGTLCQAFLGERRGREEIGPRDRHMAGEIRRLIARHPDRHLVHVGGWVHLIADSRGETLFSLLADLQPRRLLLDQEP